MKKIFWVKDVILLYLFMVLFLVEAQSQIQVSADGKFFTEKGKPFFWLGDTDWELFHRLNREEIDEVIAVRSGQGFNILQAVALAEMNGIRQPNRYGDWPLNNEDPTQLLETPGSNPENSYEYDYWDQVDYVIRQAALKGMYIGLLPTWGDKVAHLWGDGPIIFNEKNAEQFAKTLATRYATQWNVFWILGGDRPGVYKSRDGSGQEYDDRAVWRAMARGIESVLGKQALITYHPAGGSYSTSQYLQDETWLDVHAFQSGHGSRDADSWNWVLRDLALKPVRPVVDMEPCYEDHPLNPWDGKWTRKERGYFTAYDVRARVYRNVFAGAAGITYGHHQVWQFLNESLYPPVFVGDTIIGWKKALRAEAASQMQHLKNLMLSRPYYNRVAAQQLIKSNPGSTYVDLIYATRDQAGLYAFVYLPKQSTVTVDLSLISGKTKKVWWYDPLTGKAHIVTSVHGSGSKTFVPPSSGQDWVLVLDDATQNFKAPGVI